MTEILRLSSGRRCELRNPDVPLLPWVHVLVFPPDQGPPTEAELGEMLTLAHRTARRLGRRYFGDPECFSVLLNGRRTGRLPWPHVHLIPAGSPGAKHRALLLLGLKRLLRAARRLWFAMTRPTTVDPLIAPFTHTWRALGASGDGHAVVRRLLAAWTEDHRHYHDRRHLEAGLGLLAEFHAHLGRPAEVECAWWFHDAVYDPTAHDNEARSAEWAELALRGGGVAEDVVARVRAMILATAHATGATGGDTATLLDVDLAILGASPERFAAYDADVRQEYGHVSDEHWAVGRAGVLGSFAERERLFQTPWMFDRFEQQARENLAAALGR